MTAGVSLRSARAGDEAALGTLGAQLVAEHHCFDPQRFIAPEPETPRRYGAFLASQIGQPGKLLIVADKEGAVAGYLFAGLEGFDYMNLRGPAAVIYDLIVDERYRGQGIGRTLLDRAFAQLAALGAPRVLLSTADKNLGAQALFSAVGFRRTMIEMTRELASGEAA